MQALLKLLHTLPKQEQWNFGCLKRKHHSFRMLNYKSMCDVSVPCLPTLPLFKKAVFGVQFIPGFSKILLRLKSSLKLTTDKDHTAEGKNGQVRIPRDHTSIGSLEKFRELSLVFFVYFANSFNSLCPPSESREQCERAFFSLGIFLGLQKGGSKRGREER